MKQEYFMSPKHYSRRAFIKGSLSTLAVASLPGQLAFGQTTITIRPEWQEFKTSPNYSSFISAIRTMRNNTNSSSRSSWVYWANVHVNYCPHDISYFLAWHRGYLYYFEQQLRIVSGNNNLVLPYWNYYKYPTIPAEFTDPATGNPLFVNRVNTNVYNALSLSPFASTVWNFERGRENAFEPLIEAQPHNPVHNIIGGYMMSMQSPMDPIFYLHHANIDRLWHAWALPDGKGIPWADSPYWSGDFIYAPDLTLPRSQCYHPNRVGTDYSDLSTPSSLPPQAQAARIIRVQAQQGAILGRPPVAAFPATAPKSTGTGRRSLGGATGIGLAENSISVQLPVGSADSQSLQNIVTGVKKSGPSRPTPAGPYKSVQVVLDDIRVLEPGKFGGYFYKIYLNLPQNGSASSSEQRYLLGTFGPFEIEAASHHGSSGRLAFPATQVLANMEPGDIRNLTVSFVRVNGEKWPKGRVIAVGEIRAEITTEEPYDVSPHVAKPANVPYR